MIETRQGDALFRGLTAAAAGLILVIVAAILVQLWQHAAPAVAKFGWRFLFTDSWDPVTGEFGAASSIYGTVVSTALAVALATPLALVIALFLVELAPPLVSGLVGGAIELLAAIPSIIYGMWGLFVFAPVMADHVQPLLSEWLGWTPLFSGPPTGIGMLSAGIILAIMILPYICSVTRDVLRMVPAMVRESGFGMGATTWEVTRQVSLRYGLRGIVGAVLLGLGRAFGETMAVTFVIGNDHRVSLSLYDAGNTISSTLANEFAEASDPLYLSSLIGLGLVLFVVSFLFQAAANLWLNRLQRAMGQH